MTAEEFWDDCGRPEFDDRKLELVSGEVIDRPLEGMMHGAIRAWVGRSLIEHSRRGGRYTVGSNNVLFLLRRNPDSVRGPDLVVFDGDPFREPPQTTFSTTPLLLAVEVLSENDTPNDVTDRVADLEHFGTPHIWLIDPRERVVIGHSPESIGHYDEGAEIAGSGRFYGFRHSVTEFLQGPSSSGTWKKGTQRVNHS